MKDDAPSEILPYAIVAKPNMAKSDCDRIARHYGEEGVNWAREVVGEEVRYSFDSEERRARFAAEIDPQLASLIRKATMRHQARRSGPTSRRARKRQRR